MVDIRIGSNVIEAAGDGPAVVIIHGLGGSSNTFQLLMDALDGCRVLRLDLPGAGRSALRSGSNGLPGLMTPVREAMLAAGVTRAHLVGHSSTHDNRSNKLRGSIASEGSRRLPHRLPSGRIPQFRNGAFEVRNRVPAGRPLTGIHQCLDVRGDLLERCKPDAAFALHMLDQ